MHHKDHCNITTYYPFIRNINYSLSSLKGVDDMRDYIGEYYKEYEL